MKSSFGLGVVIASGIACVSPVHAAEYMFNITGSFDAAFSIDSNLLVPPSAFDGSTFVVENVHGTFGRNLTTADSITFNTAAFDGGLTIQLGADFLNLWGPVLFAGTTDMPSIRIGEFTLLQDGDNILASNLNISEFNTAVPEPMTWALMLIGFGMTGYILRKRQTTVRCQTR